MPRDAHPLGVEIVSLISLYENERGVAMKAVSGSARGMLALVLFACIGVVGCGSSSSSSSSAAATQTASTTRQGSAGTQQAQRIVSAATQGLVTAGGAGDISAGSIQPLTHFVGPTPVPAPKGKFKAAVEACAPVGGCLNTAKDIAAILGKFGWSVTLGAGKGTPQSYQSLYSSALAQHVNLIVAVGIPGVFVEQQLQQAKAAGI